MIKQVLFIAEHRHALLIDAEHQYVLQVFMVPDLISRSIVFSSTNTFWRDAGDQDFFVNLFENFETLCKRTFELCISMVTFL